MTINFSLQALKEFNIAQFCPLAYAAIMCFVGGGNGDKANKSKHLVSFFEMLEKYHFINNAVCERVGNDIEKIYADFCEKFRKSEDFEATLGELKKALLEKRADRDEFLSRFSKISYAEDPIGVIAYTFDRLYNHKQRAGSWVRIFNADPAISRRNFNTEHFFPQKPQGGIPQDMVGSIDLIGNLLCLSFITNSTLNNDMPAAKVVKLEGALSGQIKNIPAITELISLFKERGKWGSEEVVERGRRLGVLGYDEVWHF